MDVDEKEKLDAALEALEARARVRRRGSMLVTLVPVGLTALIVGGFAIHIGTKNLELYDARKSAEELDQRLAEGQVKLAEVEKSRKQLEDETKRLEDRKKDLESYLRSQRTEAEGPTTAGIARAVDAPESVVLAEEGKVPEGLRPTPRASVMSRPGIAGQPVYDVILSLDVAEAQKDAIARVVYELNPVYYISKRELVGGDAPTFEAAATVYACKSTVITKIELRDGSRMELDFDWCRSEGWPRQKSQDRQTVDPVPPQELEKRPIPKRPPTAPRDPNITNPQKP